MSSLRSHHTAQYCGFDLAWNTFYSSKTIAYLRSDGEQGDSDVRDNFRHIFVLRQNRRQRRFCSGRVSLLLLLLPRSLKHWLLLWPHTDHDRRLLRPPAAELFMSCGAGRTCALAHRQQSSDAFRVKFNAFDAVIYGGITTVSFIHFIRTDNWILRKTWYTKH